MKMFWPVLLAILHGQSFSSAQATATTCFSQTITSPDLPGGSILSLSAYPGTYPARSVSRNNPFCNVTVIYTHPGQNDTITVQVHLPVKGWNGRFLAIGGGGWATGIVGFLAGPVSIGYASATTDGGHSSELPSPEPWAQISPGNVNMYLLQDFASVALNDLAIIGKEITTSFYSTPPKHSYWAGCSMGGRQGLMMAQRYPMAFDGIFAAAPAINLAKFGPAALWPQIVMNELGEYPTACELDAITAAVITACDGLDGVIDGVISAPMICQFNPFHLIGQSVPCADGSHIAISPAAARVAEESWKGATNPSGKLLWGGLFPGASLTILAGTSCSTADAKACVGAPFSIAADWIKFFVSKNASLDISTIGYKEFARLFHASYQEFNSLIGTDDPDLSQFREAGGKMITWHGLDDQLISPYGTSHYYDRVQEVDPDVRSFYRYFEAPGVAHCGGGISPLPSDVLNTLVRWVENKEAPDTLKASSQPAKDGSVKRRNLCQYPLVSVFLGEGRDSDVAESYVCRTSFGVDGAVEELDDKAFSESILQA